MKVVIEFADQNCTIRSGMNRSKLLETLHPLAELAFVDTPLATDFESGQFFSLDHSHHGSPGQLQQLGGFLEGQQAYGPSWFSIGVSISRSQTEQRRCHDPSKYSRPFIGKSSSAVDDMKGHP